MAEPAQNRFGPLIRREREARAIGLREMAKKIGVSATYLSKVEREELPPPAEDKVKAIARLFELDPDEMLALAGKVSSDLTAIIRERPHEMAMLLRAAPNLSADELRRLAETKTRTTDGKD